MLLAALAATGCRIVSTRHLSWEQVQAAGGVRVLDPVSGADGSVLLPIDFDESGLTAVTAHPTSRDTFAIALAPEVSVSGHDIAFTIVVGDGKDRPGSVHAPPIVLRDLEPGLYQLAYRDPNGDMTPLQTIRIGAAAGEQQATGDVPGSRFGTTILTGSEVPNWVAGAIGSTGFWKPSSEDVLRAEARIADAIDLAAHRPADAPADLARPGGLEEMAKVARCLTEYRAQVVGVVVGGHRRLYFNVFTTDDLVQQAGHDWVEVEDGGYGYWRIQYDLDDDRCLGFDSNGYA